jgi:predicted DNA-binding protein (MmcQ/YjbR family)
LTVVGGSMAGMSDIWADALAWARATCLALPGAFEEDAWVGTRWKVRSNTFAHIVEIVDGWPRSFARSAATTGPATVLTFRAGGHDLDLVLGHPAAFGPLWGRTDVGVRLDQHDDWDELAELLVESYRLRAPQRLVRELDR